METVLIDTWLEGLEAIEVVDEASVSVVRDHVRSEGARLGMPADVTARLVNVASELAHNQLAHARGGSVAVREVFRGDVRGVEIVAADRGDGVGDPARALAGVPRATGSFGVGLAAVCELADSVDFDVRLGEGTCIRARKFAGRVARGRQVGIIARPCDGERVCGDNAAVVTAGASLVVAVADGLGHGPEAREASDAAIQCLRDMPNASPEAMLAATHGVLERTRGAVMAIARLEETSAECASVGNVSLHIYGRAPARRFSGSSFVLGAPGTARRPVPREAFPLASHDVVVLFSDGVSSHMDLEGRHDLLRQHPIVVAQRILEEFGRTNDDALVLVIG